ncbi:hypothetical protein [Prevotella pallens]|uniref:hypothetical protein n=1 Tax=Prevotella pallens TaxID=60133 RepID=UPI001CAD0421|nr:hypothetical protein [Prevotella pallens]MBF1451909.1 hypothetical protein [Prevotella pallens]
MCNWQCQDTGTINLPLHLAECFAPISWWTWGNWGVFALYFVGVKGTFTKCLQRVRNLFDIHS